MQWLEFLEGEGCSGGGGRGRVGFSGFGGSIEEGF